MDIEGGLIRMRIGIMGGTLDPIHNGHIAIAEAVKTALSLDHVLLLPDGDPPHKALSVSKEDRWNMVRLAAEGREGLVPCDMEIRREGTTYTYDTLTELRAKQPDTEWYYIIGEDTVQILDSWRRFPEIAKLTRFAAVTRPGSDAAVTREKVAELREKYGAEILFAEGAAGPDISSSDIRARVAEGKPITDLVPEAVERYIREKGLYLCGYSEADVHRMLKDRLNEKRYIHTLGVARTAEELARLHGSDPARARLAGLLHDCAKYMDRTEMFRYVRENVPDTDEEELGMASVVHAPAGMLMARDDFGVRDPEILSSIRKHTLGDAEMCDLDLIIYIADFIEPNRQDFEGMAQARALAREDLKRCAVYCAELSGKYVLAKGYQISSRTAKMIQNLKV